LAKPLTVENERLRLAGPCGFAAAGSVDGVIHAHARARWTGRTLRVEIEGWVDPALTVSSADALGQQVARAVARELPEAGSFTWTARAAPA
jgi:divalent metal cation (Fe/Co/Zn/Cd) transporter